MRDPDGSVTEDFGGDRKLDLATLARGHTLIIDSWNDLGAVENIFFTEPFKKVLLRTEEKGVRAEPLVNATHGFHVKAPLLPKGQTICLLGGALPLGDWNQAAPILLRRCPANGGFGVQLVLARETFPVAYKYGVYDLERNVFVRYEDGANRALAEAAPPGGRVMVNDGFARLPWAPWRGAGVRNPAGIASYR